MSPSLKPAKIPVGVMVGPAEEVLDTEDVRLSSVEVEQVVTMLICPGIPSLSAISALRSPAPYETFGFDGMAFNIGADLMDAERSTVHDFLASQISDFVLLKFMLF